MSRSDNSRDLYRHVNTLIRAHLQGFREKYGGVTSDHGEPEIAGSFDEFEYLHAKAWFALNALQANWQV